MVGRYNVAVNVALGKHLDAVVVNSKQVAIECVQYHLSFLRSVDT